MSQRPDLTARFFDPEWNAPEIPHAAFGDGHDGSFYRTLAELTSDIAYCFRLDQHGNLVLEWVNQSFERVLGYDPDDWMALGGWAAIVHPDDRHVIDDALDRLLGGASDAIDELRVVTREGDVRWFRSYSRAVSLPEGRGIRIIGAAQDMTDRVEAETRYRTISDLTSDVTFAFRVEESLETVTEWVAGAHTELTGYTFDETDTLGWRNLIHPADRPAYEERLAQLEEGAADESDVRILTKSGDVRYVRILVRRVAAPDKTMRFVGAVRDLTERRRSERLLAESEERYRAVSLLTSDIAYSYHLDEDGRVVVDWVTDGIEALTGYTDDELLALGGWRGVLVPEHRARYEARLDELFAGKAATREFEIVNKSGERRWLEISARPEMTADGQIDRIFAAARDISERKWAEDALATREAQLREAQAVAKLGSWRRDVATGRMEWSDELYEILGYEPGGVEPDADWLARHLHPDDRATFLRRLARLVESGEGHEHEFRFVRPDGRVVWIYARAQPDFDAAGNVVSVHGIAQDVTERRRHEQLHRVVSEMVSDILFSYRVVDGRLVADWVTGAYERLTGYPLPAKTPGDLFRSIAHPDDLPVIDEAEAVVLSGRSHVFELRILNHNAEMRWLKVYAQPQTGERDNDVVGVFGAAQDITATREAEAALRRAYERERDAVERLREADQVKDEFLTTASHELRTPLTAIVGFASALAKGREAFDDATYAHIVDRLERNALELGGMVERLLDFSRLEAGAVKLESRVVSLDDAVHRCIDAHATELGDYTVSVEIDPDLTVMADAAALGHVLSNLVGNAAKYAPERSTITVAASRSRRGVRVTVSDMGPGIRPEERATVFERFVRGSDQPPGTHGSGIGLAIARSYVELMGGRIWVEETPGGGATFSFEVPFAVGDRAEVT